MPRFAVVVVDITWVMVGGRLLGPLNDWVCEFATIVSQIHGVLLKVQNSPQIAGTGRLKADFVVVGTLKEIPRLTRIDIDLD